MADGDKSALDVVPYDDSAAVAWDEFVAQAPMGTFLHSRRFLGYHGDRFEDASVVLRDAGGGLVGVVPVAVDPGDGEVVVSHPGATFGGIVHDGSLVGGSMIDALTAVTSHYAKHGFARLRYAAVPFIYQRGPSADDLYALFRLGAERIRCDLSCAVDLERGPRLSSRRRRGRKKASREGVEVVAGAKLIDELWPVVEANLADRHEARPVHTTAEMRVLIDLFPEQIEVVVARHRGEAVAGVVLFESPQVTHAQYIASLIAGNEVAALDAVFDYCLSHAGQRGARFFDFGTSNRDGGRVLNEGLYGFKAQFGGGGVAYEQYELELGAAAR
jgi:hypothetical protein